MSMSNKVLWGEGLFLRPQHFQQQDRYHEQRLHHSMLAIHPYLWGVSELEIEPDLLRHNRLRLQKLALIFQDGELYAAPERDNLPEAIDLTQLPPSQQLVTLYAALPAFKHFGGNFAPHDTPSNAARFAQSNHNTPDLYTQAAEAELTYLKPALRLIADSEPRNSFDYLPLLRLRRLASGGFELDPDFVPPSLSIRSAPRLLRQLHQLIDALQAKVSALYGHHREPSKNVIEFRSGDMSSFWLLHTASSACAALKHYLQHPALHPERLYEQLLALAGALMTFSKTQALSDLPPYEHNAPGQGFDQLHRIIRDLLDTVISSKYFAIALELVKPSYYRGLLDSGKIDDRTTFYLAVSADMPGVELVEAIPLRIKVGAPDDVEQFVLSALPGVRLLRASQVPAALPARPDTYYFTLDAKGPMYERMLQAQTISLYVPAGISDLKLELLAVSAEAVS